MKQIVIFCIGWSINWFQILVKYHCNVMIDAGLKLETNMVGVWDWGNETTNTKIGQNFNF